ncbi:tyrosine-type recombinase/integrase [Phenylobacterium sp.]|uniref:tyrosine-type recombinase/integrase n=1 Tax=Phenylobacterium sp. TaxID=1871053 RepID=UPI0039197D76
MPRLTEKLVETLAPRDEEYCVWDAEVVGLGVRVRPTGAKSFVLMYRRGGKQRKHTMGKVDVGYGVKEARERAKELLRGLRDGIDPQDAKAEERKAVTVAELVDLYLAEGPALKPDKKAASWKSDGRLFECHVKPLLGRYLARDLSKVDVAKFQKDVADGKTARNVKTGHRRRSRVTGGKTVAALTLAVLGACYQFGIETGRVAHNPVRGVKRFKINRRERYLSERELAAFGEALAAFEREDPRMQVMADAVRLLIFTGCRKNEILTLLWEWVDWRKTCLRLPDSKTGARVVPLADAAVALLKRRWEAGRPQTDLRGHNSGERPEPKRRSPFVLPAMKGEGHYVGLGHHWEKVRGRADAIARRRAEDAGEHPDDVPTLTNVRIHDLRHSFASFAIADGASLFMVGKVLGHKQARTTEIYAHLSDDPVKHVANRTATRLAEAMRG